jgi:5-enolpyruvylshikimate-3-phosphate synthase
VCGIKKISSFNYTIPSDISSSAFFIVLTVLSKNSKLKNKKCKHKSIKRWSDKNIKNDERSNNFIKILRFIKVKKLQM